MKTDGALKHVAARLQPMVRKVAYQGHNDLFPGVEAMRYSLMMACACLALSGAAWADDDDCNVAMTDWQPRNAIHQMAEQQGWTVQRIKVDDGCYEIKGRDAQGHRIEVKVDPQTLHVREFEREDGDDYDDNRSTQRGDVTTGPVGNTPDNGLFNSGGASN
ncbi:PepSY domain-containing protein [Sediminimonas qiaohouensis]